MELDALRDALPELRARLDEATEAADRAARKRDALTKVIEGLEALNGAAPPRKRKMLADLPGRKRIRGREAVRRVLNAEARPMMPREIIAEVQRRGWIDANAQNPGASVRVATRRLLDDGEVEKLSDGSYRTVTKTASSIGVQS